MTAHHSTRDGAAGYILFLVAAILAVASAVAWAQFGRMRASLQYDQTNIKSLESAKEALLAYAVTQVYVANPALPAVMPTRPGELLCPDFDGDGFEDATCMPGAVGRLPWRTLGIEEPKDASGETLWYAVSGPFRRSPQGALKLNSDTTGDLVIKDAKGNVITSTAAAVILAPGSQVGSQARSGASLLVASNYFEAYRDSLNNLIGDNAATAGPFVVATPTSGFNDQVAFVATNELIPRVEARVANEIRAILDQYEKNSLLGYLPWAIDFTADPTLSITSQIGVTRGRIPLVASPENWGTTNSAGRQIPSLPTWFIANDWRNYLYYTYSAFLMLGVTGGCSSNCFVSLNGASGYLALVFTPGTSLVGTRTATRLADYLESNDAADDQYVVPPYVRLDQDHVFYIPAISRSQCTAAASQLVALAPCGQPSRINGTCVRLATQLQTCSCSSAAVQLITTPCENNLNPASCQSAKTSVQTCQ